MLLGHLLFYKFYLTETEEAGQKWNNVMWNILCDKTAALKNVCFNNKNKNKHILYYPANPDTKSVKLCH